MFNIESYLTPYIAEYLGKYVDNFNKSNFQVSLWDGDATFQNVDLNLEVIEEEWEIPLRVISGHIHEMKISVPWTKITSEPIVVTLNTLEMSFGLKGKETEDDGEVRKCQSHPTLPPDTTGYMQGLMNKIIQNAKVICRNVILKYLEDDFVISFNFEHVTLCSVNEHWEQAFIDVGGTDFIGRRKLICPDLTVCLDNLHSISKNSFTDPLLYKCSFVVRIYNQFQGPFSRIPFFRRMDILFNDSIDVCVMDEQIPMIMRLYNLFIALTQLHHPENLLESKRAANDAKRMPSQSDAEEEKEDDSIPIETLLEPRVLSTDLDSGLASDIKLTAVNTYTAAFFQVPNDAKGTVSSMAKSEGESENFVDQWDLSLEDLNKSSTTPAELKARPANANFVADLSMGTVTDTTITVDGAGEVSESSSLYDWATWAIGWIPVPSILASEEPQPEPTADPSHCVVPVFHVGLYVKSANVTMKTIDRICDRSSATSSTASSRIKTVPFLRCQIQGIICDVATQGTSQSSRGGFSKFTVDGIGYCPCGLNDCIEEFPQFPLNRNCGITYFTVGRVNENFWKGSLFEECSPRPDLTYDCRFHCEGYESRYPEEEMLRRTPGIAFDSVEIYNPIIDDEDSNSGESQPEPCCVPKREPDKRAPPQKSDSSFRIAFEEPNNKTATRVIMAPFRVKVSTGFIHRLKLVFQSVMSYDYPPYDTLLDLLIPDLRMFAKIRLDKFQCIFYDGDSGLIKDASNQIVTEFTGLKANFDANHIFTKGYCQLKNLNIRSYRRKSEGGEWDLGDCLGFVMSCADEIQPSILVAKSSTQLAASDFSSKASVTSVPTQTTSRPSLSKFELSKFDDRPSRAFDSFFAISYTKVKAAHYHESCLSTNLAASWNKVIEGKLGADSEFLVSPKLEETRFFTELDIKLKPMDIVLSSAIVAPFVKLAKEIVSVALHQNRRSRKNEPSLLRSSQRIWTSGNMPLTYLNAGKIRLFFKTALSENPDTLIVQVPSTTITSQVDNPLHRNLLRPDLFAYAEEARITGIPGSFLEDRRYEVSLKDLTISTSRWKDLNLNSLKLVTTASIDDVISLESNQTFHLGGDNFSTIVSFPLLEQFEITISFSPALLFSTHQNLVGGVLVAGYSAEVNLNEEIHLPANTEQLALTYGLYLELVTMKLEWDSALNYAPEPMVTPSIVDKNNPELIQSEESSIKEVDSGVESSSITMTPALRIVPASLFVAAKNVRVYTYKLVRNIVDEGNDSDKNMGKIIGMKPLVMVNIVRPYLICAISAGSQKTEFSMYDVTIEMGSGNISPVNEFTSPTKYDFPGRLFETLPGERNPKTGLFRPFVTCTTVDFLIQQMNINIDIARPIKFVLSKERLQYFNELYGGVQDHLITSGTKGGATEADEITLQKIVHFVSSYFKSARIFINQLVFIVLEEPPGLPKAAITISITGFELSFSAALPSILLPEAQDRCTIAYGMETLVISTLIGDRNDVFLNPCGMKIKIMAEWHTYIKIPISSINFKSDPITIFFGPQNILAFLQVYHTFGEYLMRFITAEEEEFVEILEALPSLPVEDIIFKDDLRNGTFHFVYSVTSGHMPSVYQVVICSSQRTMTWRYPNARRIESITTSPVPLVDPSYMYSKDQPVTVDCDLSCWDEGGEAFKLVGTFRVTETTSKDFKFLLHDEKEDLASSVWRITMRTPMDEDQVNIILTPDGLAGSMCINSVYSSHKIPKFSLAADIPRVAIHFVNHRTYAGKIPEARLRLYSMGGLNNQIDQTFATIEMCSCQMYISMWMQRASIDIYSNFRILVTDYAYLTDIIVIEPCSFRLKLLLYEEGSRMIFHSVTLTSQPIVVKIGASSLHTIISSTLIWMQVLKAYFGDVVDISRNHFQTHVNMTQFLICNDTSLSLSIIQANTKRLVPVPSRQCYGFTWTTQKVKSEVRIGLQEEESWSKSQSFSLTRCGTFVRNLGDTPFFISIENLYASQIMVTISGGFTIANALEIPLDVGLLATTMNKETVLTLDGRSHGPSLFTHMKDVTGLRFKFSEVKERHHHGWSNSITIDDLRLDPLHAKCVSLYEERDGDLNKHNIWCSLVEETVDSACRFLIVLSPIFRIRSILSSPTIARIATARNEVQTSFDLPGRGTEIEVDFSGEERVTHFLTFQADSEAQPSSPAIPLVPGGGPCVNSQSFTTHKRSIDDILRDIILDFEENVKLKSKWPYTREGFEVRQWVGPSRTDPAVKVSFKPWIPGLPSVLVEAKPDAIFANLTGYLLLFREDDEDMSIPSRSAFSPKNIHGKFFFGFNCLTNSRLSIWSEELQITENLSPSDVHHINSDWKIPVNSFSRLEINTEQTQIHITIETILHEGILILTLRPTFNIQNRTKFPLSACGVSLRQHRVPGDSILGHGENSIYLESNNEASGVPETSVGLLMFNCDWNPFEENVYASGMKYIAFQYSNSPWWFVRLMKFETIFDNLSAPQGIPVKRAEAAIPSCQPHWVKANSSDLVEVTLPLCVCWTCKNGQVWISVAINENPQVVIVNDSQLPLCYTEALGGQPQFEYEHFPQFRHLPPHTTGFYAFPSLQANFPQVQNKVPNPIILFGIPGVDYKMVRRLTMITRDLDSIQWSTTVKCEDAEEAQLVHIGNGPAKSYLKVLAEKLGVTYYIYVQDLSDAEISARDVRARILLGEEAEDSSQKILEFSEEIASKVRFSNPLISCVHHYDPEDLNVLLPPDQLAVEIIKSNADLQKARPTTSKSEINARVKSEDNPLWTLQIHIPETRLIFTDDFTQSGKKREILSVIVTDIFLLREPAHGVHPLRVLRYNVTHSWILSLKLGDVQLDNALFQEKRYDFPVLFKRKEAYQCSLEYLGVCHPIDYSTFIEQCFARQFPLLRIKLESILTVPDNHLKLQSVSVNCESFVVNLEDRFLAFIFPVFENFVTIITERFSLLQAENKILQAQRQKQHCKNSFGVATPPMSGIDSNEKLANQTANLSTNPDSKAIVELLSTRRLSMESLPSSPTGAESPGLISPADEDEDDTLRAHQPSSIMAETYGPFIQRPLYEDIGNEYVGIMDQKCFIALEDQECNEPDEELGLGLLRDDPSYRANYIPIPQEIVSIIKDLLQPIQLERLSVHKIQAYLTFRGRFKGMYFAFDNSPIFLNDYVTHYVNTTTYTLGDTFGKYYLLGAIYTAGNPMRLIGSLELIGSPGTLARSVGSGFKDFVIYPVRGILDGPLAFMNGLNNGCTSLVRNVSSGTLTSMTNFAWSVARNIDRLTLDEQEQLMVEETRRVSIDGISDGLLHGLTGFGIRLLGAIGGIAHHPLQAALEEGASPIGIVTGIGKGLLGAVTKPVGATVELVAMTGQGILQEVGWAHKFTRKYDVFVEDTETSSNSLLKFRWKLGLFDREPGREKILLVVDAMESVRSSRLTPVTLVITTENVYVMDSTLDQVQRKDSISSTLIKPSDYHFDPIGGLEFFKLLKLAKRIQREDIFGIFNKISTSF